MKIIKNASEILSQVSNGGRPHSAQGKALLKLQVGEGFSTTKKKANSLRVLASTSGIKISAKSIGNGAYLVCRTK